MLWIALYLPELPLESVDHSNMAHPDNTPMVLYETNHGQNLVYAANLAAKKAGIEAGMALASSEALVTELLSFERKPAQEKAALTRLARWAQQFTPVVCLQPPNGLLLEVEASLTLFGSINALQQRITTQIKPLAYTALQSLAPTPGGAWILARSGHVNSEANTIVGQRELQARVMSLPLDLLNLTHEQRNAFTSMGLKTIADCLRLPRAGLSQRLGTDILLQIDQILGHRPDPRKNYAAPSQFRSQILLPSIVTDTKLIIFALKRLLHELSGFLQARGSGAQHLHLGLISATQSTQWLALNLLSPNNDPDHLLALWQEQLERYTLSEPIEGIELQAPKLLPIQANNLDLFSPRKPNQQSFTSFLETLRNRLGEDCIQQLHTQNRHLPEQAYIIKPYQTKRNRDTTPTTPFTRPRWLLTQPLALKITPQGPWHQGRLQLVNGPERIESGWWTSLRVRRDYYIATNPQRQNLWVYRSLGLPTQWFLHGYF